jgi:hypothetical protein
MTSFNIEKRVNRAMQHIRRNRSKPGKKKMLKLREETGMGFMRLAETVLFQQNACATFWTRQLCTCTAVGHIITLYSAVYTATVAATVAAVAVPMAGSGQVWSL